MAISPYVIRFVLLTKPIPQVAPSLKELSRLLIKKRKSIGERGDPYGIPIATIIGGLQYPLKTSNVSFWPINPQTNYIIYSRKPFALRIYRRRLQGILLQALLISRLSINTVKSLRITYADLMVAVSSVSANSIKRFFFAPIQLYSSRAYSLAMSAMRSAITLSKILLRVFSKAIGRQLSGTK